MSALSDLIREVDGQWTPASPVIRLPIIGASALMLLTDYERGTKDGDVLETTDLDAATKQQLLALAGDGSALHHKHRVYIELVPNGLPFLPQRPMWHPLTELNATLHCFVVDVLDVADVVVSKLFRFSANDRSDIEAMVSRELVDHTKLIARFRSAFDMAVGDAHADGLTDCVTNLHRVERDLFLTDETPFELPDWIA